MVVPRGCSTVEVIPRRLFHVVEASSVVWTVFFGTEGRCLFPRKNETNCEFNSVCRISEGRFHCIRSRYGMDTGSWRSTLVTADIRGSLGKKMGVAGALLWVRAPFRVGSPWRGPGAEGFFLPYWPGGPTPTLGQGCAIPGAPQVLFCPSLLPAFPLSGCSSSGGIRGTGAELPCLRPGSRLIGAMGNRGSWGGGGDPVQSPRDFGSL